MSLILFWSSDKKVISPILCSMHFLQSPLSSGSLTGFLLHLHIDLWCCIIPNKLGRVLNGGGKPLCGETDQPPMVKPTLVDITGLFFITSIYFFFFKQLQ